MSVRVSLALTVLERALYAAEFIEKLLLRSFCRKTPPAEFLRSSDADSSTTSSQGRIRTCSRSTRPQQDPTFRCLGTGDSWTDLDMRSIDTGRLGAHALTLGRMFSNSNSYEPSRQSNEGAHEPHHQLGFVYMCGSQRARIATPKGSSFDSDDVAPIPHTAPRRPRDWRAQEEGVLHLLWPLRPRQRLVRIAGARGALTPRPKPRRTDTDRRGTLGAWPGHPRRLASRHAESGCGSG